MASTTSSTNCIFKSVTLAANEQFSLPPGAEIVSASGGLDSFNSTCPKPTSIETPQCYGFVIAANEGTYGSHTEPFEETQIFFTGLAVNGTSYPFSNQTGFDAGAVSTAMGTTSIGSVFSGFAVADNSDRYGWHQYIVFKTIPSIAKNLELVGYTLAGNQGSGFANAIFRIPAYTLNELSGLGNSDLPNCN